MHPNLPTGVYHPYASMMPSTQPFGPQNYSQTYFSSRGNLGYRDRSSSNPFQSFELHSGPASMLSITEVPDEDSVVPQSEVGFRKLASPKLKSSENNVPPKSPVKNLIAEFEKKRDGFGNP